MNTNTLLNETSKILHFLRYNSKASSFSAVSNVPATFCEPIALQYPRVKMYAPREQVIILCPYGWQIIGICVLSEPAMQLGKPIL